MMQRLYLCAAVVACAFMATGCELIDEEALDNLIESVQERRGQGDEAPPEEGGDAGELPDVPEEGDDHEPPFPAEEGDEEDLPVAPEDADDEAWPEEPGLGECADSEECQAGLVCTVIYGDCLPGENEDACYGVCVTDEDDDPELPEVPGDDCDCGDEPVDPENPDDCGHDDHHPENPEDGEPPAEVVPGDPHDQDPPAGCGEGEDPCEAAFEACMDGAMADQDGDGAFHEDWCIDELDMCQNEESPVDHCPGDEPPTPDEMCEEQLEFCLDGLDSDNPDDGEFIDDCYRFMDECRDMAEVGGEEFPLDPVCEEPYDTCLAGAETDEDFRRCDEDFDQCIQENLPVEGEQGPEQEPAADEAPVEPVEPGQA